MNKKEALQAYKDEMKLICSNYQELTSFINFCMNFNKKDYSRMNKAIIRHKFPNSLYVNTMKQWNKLGYAINKGEKSTCLLAPNFKKKKVVDKDGNETGEEKEYLSGFSCFLVFDASQVHDKEGKPFTPVAYTFDPMFEIDEDMNDAIVKLGGTDNFSEGYQNLHSLFGDSLKDAIAEYVLASQLCIETEEAVVRIKEAMAGLKYEDIKDALRDGQKKGEDFFKKFEEVAFAYEL